MRVGVKQSLFNHKLRKLREAMNLTQQEVADKCGINVSSYAKIETFKRFPSKIEANRIAVLFYCEEEDIFPAWSAGMYKERPPIDRTFEVSYVALQQNEMKQLCSTESIQESEDRIAEEQRQELLNATLDTLYPRERKVIEMRYGFIDGHISTLSEVGVAIGVTQERVRQIEAKAMRKLKHPTRKWVLQGLQ